MKIGIKLFIFLMVSTFAQAADPALQGMVLKLARVKNSSTQTISLAILKPTRGTEAPFVTLEPEEEVFDVFVPLDFRGGAQFAILDSKGNPRIAIGFTPNAADGNARIQMREVGVAKPLRDVVYTAEDIQFNRNVAQMRGRRFRGIAINLDVAGDPSNTRLIPVVAPAA